MRDLADPVALAQALIRCPSVTPADEGALAVLEDALGRLGFRCHRLTFEEPGTASVGNLYARLGEGEPNLAFAGHTDVVPAGDPAAWRVDPFGGVVQAGQLYGRGAIDMKGAIGAFVAATARFLAEHRPAGSISLLITGDEEGPAINGTRKLLTWLKEQGQRLDACVVGEPTNPSRLGEMIKIGRRGSLTGWLTVPGVQGHAAYPERADNPIPRLLAMLAALTAEPLDGGSEYFQASDLVDHLGRRRQSGEQRHPRAGARDLQHPLQRPLQRELAGDPAARAPGHGRRPLRAADAGGRRAVRDPAGAV